MQVLLVYKTIPEYDRLALQSLEPRVLSQLSEDFNSILVALNRGQTERRGSKFCSLTWFSSSSTGFDAMLNVLNDVMTVW
jgi:hypothetical protein